METGTTTVDYTQQLKTIIDNQTALISQLQLIANMFYWFLVIGFTILVVITIYNFLKKFT